MAFPNPLSGAATVRYTLAEASDVSVGVYDALGREVARLANGPASAGAHDVGLDGGALRSGLYLVRVLADGRTAATATVTVVR